MYPPTVRRCSSQAGAISSNVTVSAGSAPPLDVTQGVPHVLQASAPELDETHAALARTGTFLRVHLQAAG